MHALSARVAGKFAARGEGEVCAVFKRSFYLRFDDNGYACVGDESIGHGPLNAIVGEFASPALGEKVSLAVDGIWQPAGLVMSAFPDFYGLRQAARSCTPTEGLGCLVAGTHNALSAHAQPALDAVDDYFGGVMVALHLLDRAGQAAALWRWLEPRLAQRSNAISAAHLAAAAAGEAHEALHECLSEIFKREPDWDTALDRLDAVGHGSGWNALAGALAVLQKQRY